MPDVVGMTVLAGQTAARHADLVLAASDADGPPLGAVLWPHESEYLIASQAPAAGTLVRRYDSVAITYVPVDGPGTSGVREPRRPAPGSGTPGAARPLDDVGDDVGRADQAVR